MEVFGLAPRHLSGGSSVADDGQRTLRNDAYAGALGLEAIRTFYEILDANISIVKRYV
jgi:hypothetical protein